MLKKISKRIYRDSSDITKIGHFLNSLYEEKNINISSLKPFWDYSCTHPLNNQQNMKKVGIWEEHDKIVGVVFYDTFPNDVFVNVAPGYSFIKNDMIAYIEEKYKDVRQNKKLRVHTSENDKDLIRVLKSHNYKRDSDCDRPMCYNNNFANLPDCILPDGFKIISLEDEFDINKISRILHRGFNHKGEPSIEMIESNKTMFSGNNFRKELAIVIVSPDGNYAAYSCLLFESIKNYGYVEPVATDPNYRRMGLASIAILEGIKRCKEIGATDIYVGSELPVYKKLGFQRLYTELCWLK